MRSPPGFASVAPSLAEQKSAERFLQAQESAVEAELRRYFARLGRYVDARLFSRQNRKALTRAVETKAVPLAGPVGKAKVGQVSCVCSGKGTNCTFKLNGGGVSLIKTAPDPGPVHPAWMARVNEKVEDTAQAAKLTAQGLSASALAFAQWAALNRVVDDGATQLAQIAANAVVTGNAQAGLYSPEEFIIDVAEAGPEPGTLTVEQEDAIQQSFGKLDKAQWDDELRGLSTKLMGTVFGEAGSKIKDAFGLAFDLDDPGVQTALDNAVNRIVGTNQTTWNAIRNELKDGIAAGESIAKLQKRVKGVFDQADRYRARVIARTEALSAVNTSQHLAAKDSGVVKQKRWLAASDHRTRESHAQANGQTVDLEDTFSIGGFPMLHPGDRNAPAREVIQCRCTVIYVTDDALVYPDGKVSGTAPKPAQSVSAAEASSAPSPASKPPPAPNAPTPKPKPPQAATEAQQIQARVDKNVTNGSLPKPTTTVDQIGPLSDLDPGAAYLLRDGYVTPDIAVAMTTGVLPPIPLTAAKQVVDAEDALDWIVSNGKLAVDEDAADTLARLWIQGHVDTYKVGQIIDNVDGWIPSPALAAKISSGEITYDAAASIAGKITTLTPTAGAVDEVAQVADDIGSVDGYNPLNEPPPPPIVPKQNQWWAGAPDGEVKKYELNEVVRGAQRTGASLGGAHSKVVFKDEDGVEWLFKPQDEFRAIVDVQTAKLQHLAGFEAPPTYLVTVDGQVGSVQQMFGSEATRRQKFKGGQFDPTRLASADVAELQAHATFDWLIGNHDGHVEQFLRLSDSAGGKATGQIIGIDKGQAFKFFGADKLDGVYNPNANFIGNTVYNIMHATVKASPGSVAGFTHVMDVTQGAELRTRIRQIMAIPDEQVRDIMRPYAEQALRARPKPPWASQFPTVDDFLDGVVARKNNLLRDTEKLHDKLLGKPPPPPKLPDGLKGMGGNGLVLHRGLEDAKRWAIAKLTDPTTLTGKVYDDVRAYTGSHYDTINSSLRSGRGTQRTSGIDKAMEPLPDDIMLARGVDHRWVEAYAPGAPRGDAASIRKALEGKVIVDDGYVSTSIGGQAAFSSQPVSLKIRANAGTHGVYVDPISMHRGENELLLGRGQQMFVHSVKQEGGKVVIELEVMPAGYPPPKKGKGKA